jgi:hypothetical protein
MSSLDRRQNSVLLPVVMPAETQFAEKIVDWSVEGQPNFYFFPRGASIRI